MSRLTLSLLTLGLSLAPILSWAGEPNIDHANGQLPQPGAKKQANSQFGNADLRGRTWKNGQRMPSTFAGTDLSKATFQSVQTLLSFRNANLKQATLNESRFVGVDFRNAKLDMARFVKCVLPAARFIGANCVQISFRNCNDICGVDFSDGNLLEARFDNCSLPAARFVGEIASRSVSGIATTSVARTSAMGTSQGLGSRSVVSRRQDSLARIAGESFFRIAATSVAQDFSDADLELARFDNCRLPAARFVGANCRRIIFQNCSDICGAGLQ